MKKFLSFFRRKTWEERENDMLDDAAHHIDGAGLEAWWYSNNPKTYV